MRLHHIHVQNTDHHGDNSTRMNHILGGPTKICNNLVVLLPSGSSVEFQISMLANPTEHYSRVHENVHAWIVTHSSVEATASAGILDVLGSAGRVSCLCAVLPARRRNESIQLLQFRQSYYPGFCAMGGTIGQSRRFRRGSLPSNSVARTPIQIKNKSYMCTLALSCSTPCATTRSRTCPVSGCSARLPGVRPASFD